MQEKRILGMPSHMDKNSKIYVAGHRGLVGSALLRKLVAEGYRNIIVRTSKELDLRKQAAVETFFAGERPEYVFLAAAKVGGILANSTYTADFIYDNIMIAANTIHAASRTGVKKLLNLGSSCIYPKFAPQPMKEEHLLTGPLEPTNEPYAIAKIAAIKLCRYYNEQYGTNFLSVMPTNLYGPHDNFNLETAHVLPALMRKFHLARLLSEKRSGDIMRDLAGTPLGSAPREGLSPEAALKRFGITADHVELWGSGEPYREFLHVDDLAEACVYLMKRYNVQDIGEFVNIGTGEDITIKQLAELTKEIVRFRGEIRHDRSKPDGTPRKLLDVGRIQALGWKAAIPLKKGIELTYAWYRESMRS